MNNYQTLKQEAYKANMKLPELGLVIFTFGNVSVVDRKEKLFAIKPSGVPYEKLAPDDMVIVDFHGNKVEGSLNPSSDTKTHALLYQKWDQIGSIVHTHSTYATAWAQAQRAIPILGTTHADHATENIPCAPVMEDEMIEGDYEHNTGLQILNYFNQQKLNYQEMEMILVGAHAPFTWGKTPEKALYNSAILEQIAQMAFLTLQINSSTESLKMSLIKKHYQRKHGKDSYYGQ